MTDLRKAAQQALEALDAYSWEQVDAARTALKAALAEPVQEKMLKQQAQVNRDVLIQALEALEWSWGGEPIGTLERDAITALRAALADQPQTTHWQGCEEVHPECAAKSWGELEKKYQAGCDHCNHPLYAGIKCGVCGRWTDK